MPDRPAPRPCTLPGASWASTSVMGRSEKSPRNHAMCGKRSTSRASTSTGCGPALPDVRMETVAAAIAGSASYSAASLRIPPRMKSGLPVTRMSVPTSYRMRSVRLFSRVPPTVVARMPNPVTSTSSSTSHVYWSGLRPMCHRVIASHTGDRRTSVLNSGKAAVAGITAINPTSATNSHPRTSGVSRAKKAARAAACPAMPAANAALPLDRAVYR